MTTLKSVTIVAALLVAGTPLALAQNGLVGPLQGHYYHPRTGHRIYYLHHPITGHRIYHRPHQEY
jgi:hypothetical protein